MAVTTIDDSIAERMGAALKTANRFAIAAGVEPEGSRVTLSRRVSEEGVSVWRINYGLPSPTITRGGDFIVEVRVEDGSFYRILQGQ
ncbi:MAG: hypothetical protein WCP07_05915 [bacterium]|jgi:hypothetical protein